MEALWPEGQSDRLGGGDASEYTKRLQHPDEQ
jgi:hypothetical protein